MPDLPLRLHPYVAAALAAGGPVVALESTIVAHGIPRPDNLRVARELEAAVREEGAVPATIAVVAGEPRIGLEDAALELVAERDDVVKAGVRDLPHVVAAGGHGATTVGATSYLAHLAGVELFATGGLGGVHREARDSWDESADLGVLARTPVCVVCAGVKSLLDLPATLERLESLSVGVLGYGTGTFPAFYLHDSGHPLDWRADTPAEVAAVLAARRALRVPQALVVANPVPRERQLDPALHDRVLAESLAAAAADGVRGKAVTPYLLDRFHRATEGASLRVNVDLVVANARLAARIAVTQVTGRTER